MEKRNLILFVALSLAIWFGWMILYPEQYNPAPVEEAAKTEQVQQSAAVENKADELLKQGVQYPFETDLFQGVIDGNGGDIRQLKLLKYEATDDQTQSMSLFYSNKKPSENTSVYITRSGLIDKSLNDYILKDVSFVGSKPSYKMTSDTLEVKLTASKDGVVVDKIYTFTKGSYLINLTYNVQNNSDKPLSLAASYSIIRDGKTPEGESRFVHTYTGPAVYTPEGKFQKVSFGDLDSAVKNNRDSANYVRASDKGWVGMVQHYFISTWIMDLKGKDSTCGPNKCQIEVRKRTSDDLYSVGLRSDKNTLAPGAKESFSMNLYSGPADYKTITGVADKLELSKDYGRVHIFSSPLFATLNGIHTYVVQNWGWSIILLTILVKILLFPLTAASYRSMAKMRNVAPHMQLLKEQCGDDKAKLQQEMMALYKREKINPLGGCLPMLLQIPIFIGLYWALLSSVELRQAPWAGWIQDLARPDPYYILPIIMAVTMFAQTFLNPPPPDPMQARMMKIMPLAFSFMFFFFPSGLVLYYVVNNMLSILQQWLINKKISPKKETA